MRLALASGACALALAVLGLALDRTQPDLPQAWLFASLQVASLAGAAAGAGLVWRRFPGPGARALLVAAAALAWRLSFFPIMVFSGHLAAIAEWIEVHGPPLPLAVWPVFLVALFALHGTAAVAVSFLVRPFHPALTGLVAGAFTVATLISCSTAADLTPLPDRVWSLGEAVPPVAAPAANPYLPELGRPGRNLAQRALVLAAGLTYPTIPESPWAAGVKGTLEELFRSNPRGSSGDRVAEHYLAYHAAHHRIGCRTLDTCPDPAPANAGR
jgi:hypothetical protein